MSTTINTYLGEKKRNKLASEDNHNFQKRKKKSEDKTKTQF